MIQLSHPYMTIGKTIALTSWTFVGKVYFYFMAAVTIGSDFEAPQNKVSHCFHPFPLYLP